MEKLTVLVLEPEKAPYTKEIEDTLAALQQAVGGYIEATYPFKDDVALICNEEGKLNGLPFNRALRDEDGKIYDIVAGTFLIAGLREDNFGSLSSEQIEKYKEQFRQPELFFVMNGKIVVMPTKPEKAQPSLSAKLQMPSPTANSPKPHRTPQPER